MPPAERGSFCRLAFAAAGAAQFLSLLLRDATHATVAKVYVLRPAANGFTA